MKKSAAPSWKKIAAAVGEAITAARLHARVRTWLEQNVHKNEPWSVAVSGGSDSVALLLLLWAHFPEKRKTLRVLHFDHAARPDSATDAQFVEAMAKELGVAFAAARRAPSGAQSEAALREARWRFIREQVKIPGASSGAFVNTAPIIPSHQAEASFGEFNPERLKERKARIIFFGHQCDDIAETMLMRLARGSGASGLCVPRPVREFPDGVVALRPLLDLSHEVLQAALKTAGAAWREDSSNAGGHFLRNRIRHQVIPVWQKAIGARDLVSGVARARAALEDDADALEAQTVALMRDLPAGEPLLHPRFSGQPRAVVRRALWWWLGQNKLANNLNAQAFDTLLDALVNAQPGRWSAGPGRWLVLDAHGLSLSGSTETTGPASWVPHLLKPGQAVNLPLGATLSARIVDVDKNLIKELKNGKINPAKKVFLALPTKSANLSLQIRPWQPGDRYRPLGAPGRRKLQDLFTDRKIPLKERHRLPVVCREDNEPLWVPGLPPAHDLRVLAATRTALELTYRS